MAANRKTMGRLHERLAKLMLDELEWYSSDETNPEHIPMPAADKGAIAKFLKDNDVTCDPMEAGHLDELRDQFYAKKDQRAALMAAAEGDLDIYHQAH